MTIESVHLVVIGNVASLRGHPKFGRPQVKFLCPEVCLRRVKLRSKVEGDAARPAKGIKTLELSFSSFFNFFGSPVHNST